MAGENMVALAEKALLWPRESTLFVADVHLGKEASMLATGIPVPLGSTRESLTHLTRVLNLTEARRLVLLGDLWHAKAGRTLGFTQDFVAWRNDHAAIQMLLVEGNHDLKSGILPPEANVLEVKEPHHMGPFALCHYPDVEDRNYVLSGHLHPGVVLEGKARQSLRLPCFWFGERAAVLPAFGLFTGCSRIQPQAKDRVFAIAEGTVYPVSLTS